MYNATLALSGSYHIFDRALPVSVSGTPGKWKPLWCTNDPAGVNSGDGLWYHPAEVAVTALTPSLQTIIAAIAAAN